MLFVYFTLENRTISRIRYNKSLHKSTNHKDLLTTAVSQWIKHKWRNTYFLFILFLYGKLIETHLINRKHLLFTRNKEKITTHTQKNYAKRENRTPKYVSIYLYESNFLLNFRRKIVANSFNVVIIISYTTWIHNINKFHRMLFDVDSIAVNGFCSPVDRLVTCFIIPKDTVSGMDLSG